MLILLALFVQATAEWVEISQRHYRKPLRNNFHSTIAELFEDTTHGTAVYHNMSLTHSFTKGSVNKTPKLGSIQRVHPSINSVKAPTIQGMISHGLHNKQEEMEDYESDQINFKHVFPATSEASFDSSDEIVGKTKIFLAEKPATTQSFATKNIRYGSTESVAEKTSAIHSKYRLQTDRNKANFVTEKADVDNEDSNMALEQISSEYTTNGPIEMFTSSERVHEDHIKYSQIKNTPGRNHNSYSQKKKVSAIDQTLNSNNTGQASPVDDGYSGITIEDQKHREPEDSVSKESNQTHSIENLLKFLKVVSDTIRRNTHRSVSSKTRYLENLKDTILANIEDRIESLWPEQQRGRRRRRRAARGHLEIPSSESALMSISFLTFAVFLIKLVLQLIQTYKTKTMMVAPTVITTAGRVAAAASRHYKP